MAQIQLLQVGCTFADIIDTVNAIIAVLNNGSGISVSYEELEHKPTINGVELSGALNTGDLLLALSGCTDYNTLMARLATKAYADAAKTAAVAAAQAAAQAELNNKMDKNLGNIEAVTTVGDDGYIPVVSGGKVVKITTSSLAAYTDVKIKVEGSTAEQSMKQQRKTLTLTGTQDGRNLVFACTEGFTLGTSALFLNGNRLYQGVDYKEDTSYQITFKTFIPEAEDVILFEGIPLE